MVYFKKNTFINQNLLIVRLYYKHDFIDLYKIHYVLCVACKFLVIYARREFIGIERDVQTQRLAAYADLGDGIPRVGETVVRPTHLRIDAGIGKERVFEIEIIILDLLRALDDLRLKAAFETGHKRRIIGYRHYNRRICRFRFRDRRAGCSKFLTGRRRLWPKSVQRTFRQGPCQRQWGGVEAKACEPREKKPSTG